MGGITASPSGDQRSADVGACVDTDFGTRSVAEDAELRAQVRPNWIDRPGHVTNARSFIANSREFDSRRYQFPECRVPQLVHVQRVPAMSGGFTKLPHEHFTYSFRHSEHR